MSTDLRARQLAHLGGRPALVVVDVQRSFADPGLIAGWGADLAAVASAVLATADLARGRPGHRRPGGLGRAGQ